MNIDHIKTFLDVYHAGSFIAVAKERNVAPSSITRTIAALETNLNLRLFQRSTRSLAPTDAGDVYYRRMLPIIEELAHIHDTLQTKSEAPSGRLRVTTSVSYGQIIIAPKLKEFRDKFPEIKLELILTDSRVDLITEQIDVAIRHGNLPDSNLVAQKLNEVSYFLVASPDYIEATSPINTPEDLAKHNLIAFSYKNFRSEWRFQKSELTKRIPIEPALTISNANLIRQTVTDGLGIAMLADWTVKEDLAEGRLVRLLPAWETSGIDKNPATWIVYPSNRFIPAKTRAFVNFLKQ